MTQSLLAPEHPLAALDGCAYLKAAWAASNPAAAGAPTHTPIWFQRQAGRSLPEYAKLRQEAATILDAIAQPDLAAEITLQPVRRYGVDAAVLFSDIVVPVAAVGFGVKVVPGTGPVVERPFASRADLDRLGPPDSFDPDTQAPYVAEAVRLTAAQLASQGHNVPLVGFAGAPFTVASYLIEGGPSRDLARTKALMLQDPKLFHDLMERLASIATASIRSQVIAGASAAQLFDTWAGALTPADYEQFVLPHSRRVFADLSDLAQLGVARAHFGVTTGELLGLMASVDCEVVGVDWRVPLATAAKRIEAQTGRVPTLQGNLDPAACLAGWPAVKEKVTEVLASAAEARPAGHIFNLGHGVLPQTDPDVLAEIVRFVQTSTAGTASSTNTAKK